MKKLLKSVSLVMALLIVAACFAGCGKEDKKDSKVKGATDKKDAENFVIATDKGFSPFEFEDAKGNICGIDMDLLEAIAKDQGFTYELHYIGWDAAIAECQAGQADGMIAGASITDDRIKDGWIFSDGYYEATQGMAVAKDSKIKEFKDLKGKTVVVKNGTMSDEYATKLSGEYAFKVVRVSTSPDMYAQVQGGQADACFDDTPILKYSIKEGELDMKYIDGTENEPANYGFATFSKDSTKLLELFNAGLKNIKESGEYDKIVKKYLG